MKKKKLLYRIISVCLLILFVFAGCSKPDSGNKTQGSTETNTTEAVSSTSTTAYKAESKTSLSEYFGDYFTVDPDPMAGLMADIKSYFAENGYSFSDWTDVTESFSGADFVAVDSVMKTLMYTNYLVTGSTTSYFYEKNKSDPTSFRGGYLFLNSLTGFKMILPSINDSRNTDNYSCKDCVYFIKNNNSILVEILLCPADETYFDAFEILKIFFDGCPESAKPDINSWKSKCSDSGTVNVELPGADNCSISKYGIELKIPLNDKTSNSNQASTTTTQSTTKTTTNIDTETDIPEELAQYADKLEKVGKDYQIYHEGEQWNVVARSTPVYKKDPNTHQVDNSNKLGYYEHGSRIYVAYIYDGIWAVVDDVEEGYVFVSMYADADPSKDSTMRPYD